ncbi:hypothetical protein [Beijerinckia mobilis]|uniref:hypothetical protein n=1 Tax=Beijerinckia mobilis TaxID=231434 RepID=UPI0012EC68C6|nr:hypothetical protein [Beijerinckia mobilis]
MNYLQRSAGVGGMPRDQQKLVHSVALNLKVAMFGFDALPACRRVLGVVPPAMQRTLRWRRSGLFHFLQRKAADFMVRSIRR